MNKKRLLQNIRLALKPGARKRGEYLKEKHIFASVGENVHFQPRLVPLYPKLIKFHNNIIIRSVIRIFQMRKLRKPGNFFTTRDEC